MYYCPRYVFCIITLVRMINGITASFANLEIFRHFNFKLSKRTSRWMVTRLLEDE